MGTGFFLYTVATAISTVVAATVAIYAWLHRDRRGAKTLTVLLVGETIWAGSAFAMTFDGIRGTDATFFWSKVLVTGVLLTVMGTVLFVLEYTGRERFLRPRWIALVAAIPLVATAVAWIEPTGWIWQISGSHQTSVTGWAYTFGPVFRWAVAYMYLLLAVMTVWLLRFALTSEVLFRGQVYGIIVAIVVPWTASILNQAGVTTYYWPPVGFAIAGVAYSWTIFQGKLFDITPIARRTVVERIDSGMVVVDTDDRIIDANDAAVSLFDRDRDAVLGMPAEEVLAWQSMRPAAPTTITEETTLDGRDVRIEISPLSDDLDRFVGFVVLIQDISDLKRRERQLRSQNRQLDRFAGVVSHDLRNPLNVVSGNIELAKETGDLERLDRAETGVERMEALIDDLLTLAREGRDVTDMEAVEVDDVVAEAWGTVETEDARLAVDAPVTVEADPVRLRQLFENLFRNAVEHGTPGQAAAVAVSVGVLREGEAPSGFYVADDGPGIPPEERDHVLEDGFSTGEDGTGLGLSIVQGIVESHGWTLDVTESEDGGARFEIRGVRTAELTASEQ